MTIIVKDTNLIGVKLVEPSSYVDHRGYYIETYNEQLYEDSGIEIKFIQDDISVSKKMSLEVYMVTIRHGNL